MDSELILRLAHQGDQLSIISKTLINSRLHQRTSLVPVVYALTVANSGDPLLRFSRFIKVVVLVVLRTLQGQLEREAILGDLVDPYARGNLGRSRVSSARLARLGRSVRLR